MNNGENIQKGDAGNASKEASKRVLDERLAESERAERASIIGTDQDTDGRSIPMGEPMDDVRVREVARYFDVNPSEFRDAAIDLADILQAVQELTGHDAMSDILLTISEMEKAITPAHSKVSRYVHFRNYLLEKMVEHDVRKRVMAWER